MTSASMPRSAMTLRAAAHRRSSSRVEIGLSSRSSIILSLSQAEQCPGVRPEYLFFLCVRETFGAGHEFNRLRFTHGIVRSKHHPIGPYLVHEMRQHRGLVDARIEIEHAQIIDRRLLHVDARIGL